MAVPSIGSIEKEVSEKMESSQLKDAYEVALNFLKQWISNDQKQSNLLGKELLDMLIKHNVPATLVKLHDSLCKNGIQGNYTCSYNLMKHFIDLIWKIALEEGCYDECASVIVLFHKQHGKSPVESYVHSMCRITLQNVLEKKPDYAISFKYGLDPIADIFTFLQSSYGFLHSFCISYHPSLARYSHSYSTDFKAFSRVFCNAIKHKVPSIPISVSSLNRDSDKEIISFHDHMFNRLLRRVEKLLQYFQEKPNPEHIAPMWSLCLFVLEELNNISKIFKDADNEFCSVLKNQQDLLCQLLCEHTEGTYDLLWLLELKDVITSKCRMRLAKKKISDQYISKASKSVDDLVNWSKSYENLSTAIENVNNDLELALPLICCFLLHHEHHLFRACDNRTTFYPNPELNLQPHHLKCFEFLGVVIALALLHEVQVSVTFHRVFLLQLAEEHISLEDLKDVDPSFYTRCTNILDMDDSATILDIDGTEVDADEKHLHVWGLIENRFIKSISEQKTFFQDGFHRVFGVPFSHLLSSGGLEIEDVNNLLQGSSNNKFSPCEMDKFFNNVGSESSDLISQLLKVKGQVRDISNWQKGKKLGGGSDGVVYERFAEDGSFYAVKEIPKKSRNDIDLIKEEAKLLCQLDHKNIVKYSGTSEDESNLYIIFELLRAGSLKTINESFRLDESHIYRYTKQLLEGLKYLHHHNVSHRDIKGGNLLVDESGCLKITDFGCARTTDLTSLMKTHCGTKGWMAPEVFGNAGSEGYDGKKADIWSVGCTVYEMFTKGTPSSDLELKAINVEHAKDFINKCLAKNPDDRPTAAELLKHQFVNRGGETSK